MIVEFLQELSRQDVAMNNKPPGKISLNLGGLKLGSSSKAFEDEAEPSTSKKSMGMGFKTFGQKPTNSNAEPSTSKPFEGMSFGSFGKASKPIETEEPDLVAESTDDMAKIMGFSGFGDMKKAKQFDMSKILEDATSEARKRNAANNLALEAKADEMAKETAKALLEQKVFKEDKSKEKSNDSDSDSDDEFIGPPIPKDLNDSTATTENEKETKVKST